MEQLTVEQGWLSYPQAEQYTGLSRGTLWRAMDRGELRAARVGRAVRFERQELERFMREAAGIAEQERGGG